MALSDAQKAAIRRYLGRPDIATEADHALEAALTDVSADAETIAEGILTRLDALEAQRTTLISRVGVDQADTLRLDTSEGYRALRLERRHAARDLARIFGVELWDTTPPASGPCHRG